MRLKLTIRLHYQHMSCPSYKLAGQLAGWLAGWMPAVHLGHQNAVKNTYP